MSNKENKIYYDLMMSINISITGRGLYHHIDRY